jgi:hypothetical protein
VWVLEMVPGLALEQARELVLAQGQALELVLEQELVLELVLHKRKQLTCSLVQPSRQKRE